MIGPQEPVPAIRKPPHHGKRPTMDLDFRRFFFSVFVIFLTILNDYLISADTYSVKVETEQHVNLVDSNFLSFTIDPKYLFSSSEKYNTKECICMASALTPAYIRIAGPSTSHMKFKNTTITIDEFDEPKKLSLSKLFRDDENDRRYKKSSLAVTNNQWEKFVQWAKSTGFDLVFALNSDEKTSSGMWDPNTALKILTVADQSNIGDIFWQLGYECHNQSIEEYLNDLETLRVIIETFPPGKAGRWQVVGGDVTHCLQADSKSDFKDYVTLSNDMLDAILLDGNSSSQELERMSDKDRLKLLKLLSRSDTPLWLTEHSQMSSELDRAVEWMTSLGYSARNGFSVHYRELMEKELYEPTLSFYMALLYKNLVGSRVLSVQLSASNAALFAHCAAARGGRARGALALYGANLGAEPARLAVRLNAREDGGDVMQFILGHDHSGNIVVNNRAMYYEGDIRPVVKRVRPYKTLLLNLPPKSFGFWVLANTKVKACYDFDDKKNNKLTSTPPVDTTDNEESNFIRKKRSVDANTNDFNSTQKHQDEFVEFIDGPEGHEVGKENKALQERIDEINKDLRNVQRIFQANLKRNKIPVRVRRETFHDEESKKPKRYNIKTKYSLGDKTLKHNIIQKLSRFSKDHISRIKNKSKSSLNNIRHYRNKSKRNLKGTKTTQKNANEIVEPNISTSDFKSGSNNIIVRKRRNVKDKLLKMYEGDSAENEISDDSKETSRFTKILHKIKQISDLPLEIQDKDLNDDYDLNSAEGIVLKTKVSDDSATIDISDKSHTGLLKSTLEDILSLLADFNKNINRFWSAITILE
ncbi:heparanase [Nymphalis io]|uniref:heparanase n=1 Tax=Inachis io TaxID=171585 RepID=UPI0021687964|nr:heparanase [Nymphalis io]